VPQRRGDKAELLRLMDMAERLAGSAAPADDGQALVYRDNMHALLESRTKEAMWLGEMDLALERAQRLCEVDPYDPKIWLELGQVRWRRKEYGPAAEAYLTAALLGSPASPVARHMAGLCFRELGQPAGAGFLFALAVAADSSAISPRDEIELLPDMPPFAALKEWNIASFSL
jgi:tetratricopeptide (TPR) repeat protein